MAVAEVNGAPVGRCCLDLECAREAGAGFAFAAHVLPDWRSRGVGARLDRHLGRVALAHGLRTLRCVNAKSNRAALRWHERLGYRRAGEGVVRWTGRFGRQATVDCWQLERRLAVSSAS